MVQLLAWQWALIALAIAAFISLVAFGIYMLWIRKKWNIKKSSESMDSTAGSFSNHQHRHRGMIERNYLADEEVVEEGKKKDDSDSAIGRVSPRFPSSFLLQQKQQYQQNNSDSIMTTSESIDTNTIDLEKAQQKHPFVMMPLSAPPPRPGRRKPKLVCAAEPQPSSKIQDGTTIAGNSSLSDHSSSNDSSDMKYEQQSVVVQEKNSPSTASTHTQLPPSLPSPLPADTMAIASSSSSQSKNENTTTTTNDNDDKDIHEQPQRDVENENISVVPMAMQAYDSGTSSTVPKRPFVLTPFIESPTTTTSTSGRSTSERMIINNIPGNSGGGSDDSSATHSTSSIIEQQQQQQQILYNQQLLEQEEHQQRPGSSTASSSYYVLANSSMDRLPSSCNNSHRGSSSHGDNNNGGGSRDNTLALPDQQHQHTNQPYTINKSLTSTVNKNSDFGGWRGPTPPWTLLRNDSFNNIINNNNNNNKSNDNH
ncbi:hypothetical protein BDA99DRAFT_604506 [Phascolomyces articulosus]|uniref:Uncharacterized protein n=1 Tax=Phascolomyces articulosus TaxID=60185 RepID=A0AAD5PFB5_9FUNG|nr:hypothetical protein BDA99DRAFT_604506 [Phascolomyces articulosus]